ncbi:hypothetical protein BDY24DRAFT_382499 [Mrakia frigida]|uniref:putative quinol monooxygenase n=1 Tax=Mrakia frigida TaxID=29902 RepID=UPI003FCBFB5B
MTLIVQARITVKEEGVAVMHAKLLEASAEYLTHPGCTRWDVMRSTKNPLEFSIVEHYDNQEAIAFHQASTYYAEFGKVVKPLATAMSVEVYETLSASSKL